jgi:hypothetical protein
MQMTFAFQPFNSSIPAAHLTFLLTGLSNVTAGEPLGNGLRLHGENENGRLVPRWCGKPRVLLAECMAERV